MKNGKRIVFTCGYFNPIHKGHIRLLRQAAKLGDRLIVSVSSDRNVEMKGSVPFMGERERMEIVEAIKGVDVVILSDSDDGSVTHLLEKIRPDVLAKGGDRTEDNMPKDELEVCERLGIQVAYNVGGGKVQSSSWLMGKRGRQ